jgi:hypothetical protein
VPGYGSFRVSFRHAPTVILTIRPSRPQFGYALLDLADRYLGMGVRPRRPISVMLPTAWSSSSANRSSRPRSPSPWRWSPSTCRAILTHRMAERT